MRGNITFTMIKPTAMSRGYAGHILCRITDAGFKFSAMKLVRLSKDQAAAFYAVHQGKPFYNSLVEFMSSGPIIAAVLEKENAVAEFRKLIGNTDPQKAEKGTIRYDFGTNLQANAVHGSDSDDNANIEADFFFSKFERY
ncbi:MAG: nucleoside-diphosphate kinase [Sphingobacteriia bacterium]|nr:nucleoside-diphosphate kinase [Sphingobacteriia bacterium]